MNKFFNSKYSWIALLVIAIGINIFSSFIHFRADLTTERRYTLSEPTKNLLAKLDSPVTIDVFLKGDLKSGAKKLAQSTTELLEEFKRYANGKIQFRFSDPLPDLDDSAKSLFLDSLQKMGIQPKTVVAQSKKGEEQSQRIIIPAAIVRYGNHVSGIDLLKGVKQVDENTVYNNAEALLEYKFASAINKVTLKESPAIGYVTGNGEPLDFSVFHLVEGLRKNYRFALIRLDSIAVIPPIFKALVLVKPLTRFSDDEKLKLDQYVMHGGNIMYLIDNLHAEMDSLRADKATLAYDRGLNLEDIFFKYGVRVNQDLVQDMQCATINFVVGMNGDKPQMQPLPWPYFPLLTGSLTHPISKNLDPVYSKFSNSVDTVKAAGIRKTVLLQTSLNGRITGAPAIITFETVKSANDPAVFNTPNIPVAVLLEGKFNSLYANRISTGKADTLSAIYNMPFLATANKSAKIIVCAGAEIARNEVTQRGPAPMGYNKDINYTFANEDFIQNCIDYLVDPSGILETRAKDFTMRLLDPKKVEDDRTFWQFTNIVLPLLLVVLCGLAYQAYRKRKYTGAVPVRQPQ